MSHHGESTVVLQFASDLRVYLNHYTIYCHGHEGKIDSSSLEILKFAAPISFEDFVSKCQIELPHDFPAQQVFDLASLPDNVRKSETALQTHLNSKASIANGIDTSTYAKSRVSHPYAGQCPLFSPPCRKDNGQVKIILNAQPDFLALSNPGCFEVKSDSQVLLVDCWSIRVRPSCSILRLYSSVFLTIVVFFGSNGL
jgi:hypothetical protein